MKWQTLIIFLIAQPVLAAGITARISQQWTQLGEPIIIEITVEGSNQEPVAPHCNCTLTLQGHQTALQWHNGHTSRQTTYHYALLPQQLGKLEVGAFTVRVQNTLLSTEPFTLTLDKRLQPLIAIQARQSSLQLRSAAKKFLLASRSS